MINFFRNLKLSANEEEIIGEGNIMGTLKQYQKNATYFSGAFTNESSFNADIAAGGVRKQMALARLKLGSRFYMMMAPLGYFSVAGGSHIDVPGKTTGGKFWPWDVS